MRELTVNEMEWVAGGGKNCRRTALDAAGGGTRGNEYGGISDTYSVGDDFINIYEGLVNFTSHVIERVANSWPW